MSAVMRCPEKDEAACRGANCCVFCIVVCIYKRLLYQYPAKAMGLEDQGSSFVLATFDTQNLKQIVRLVDELALIASIYQG